MIWMTDDGGGDDDGYVDASPARVCLHPCHYQTTSRNPAVSCVSVCVKASLAGIDFCCGCDRATCDPRWAASVAQGSGLGSDPRSSPRSENSAPPEWSRDCPRLARRTS